MVFGSNAVEVPCEDTIGLSCSRHNLDSLFLDICLSAFSSAWRYHPHLGQLSIYPSIQQSLRILLLYCRDIVPLTGGSSVPWLGSLERSWHEEDKFCWKRAVHIQEVFGHHGHFLQGAASFGVYLDRYEW
jgi:hypothetical protein